MNEPMIRLRNYLSQLPPGRLEDASELMSILAGCCGAFEGSSETSMTDEKVYRAEDIEWEFAARTAPGDGLLVRRRRAGGPDSTGQELFVSCGGLWNGKKETDVYSTGVVPEPSSIALSIVCGLCLLGYEWQRRNRPA
jgi:hypothetical protein